jgi:hypothetical protein
MLEFKYNEIITTQVTLVRLKEVNYILRFHWIDLL